MKISESFSKLGDKAVDLIKLEVNQMLDRLVWPIYLAQNRKVLLTMQNVSESED